MIDENTLKPTPPSHPSAMEQREYPDEHIPVLRVWLMDSGRLAWRVPPCYEQEPWSSRRTARAIFFLLLCAPNRQALRGQLIGILWPETPEENAQSNLRSALKVLRQVLRQPPGDDPLMEATQNREALQLKGQEIIWTDVDALELLVQQANQEPDPQRAFLLWQQARALLKGEVLAEDRLHEWVNHRWIKVKRHRMQALRRHVIRSLADLSVQRGEQGQAITLLQEHIISFPTDQDALYRLLKLLMQAECFEEARATYERGKVALQSLGKSVTESVKGLAEHLMTLPQTFLPTVPFVPETPIQQVMQDAGHHPNVIAEHVQTEPPVFPLFSTSREQLNSQKHMQVSSSVLGSENGLFLPDSLSRNILPTEASSKDCAIWFGIKQAQIITHIVQWKNRALFCGELQEQLDQEMRMFDQARSLFDDGEKYALSRRQVLLSIAMLPVAFLKTVPQSYPFGFDVEEFLPRCTASITAVWHLLKGSEFIMVEDVLVESLPTLFTLARKPSPYQETAAQLASQNCLLMSLLARHRGNNLALDEWYSREAVFYSELTTNRLLQIATLKHLADTCYYRAQYRDMLLAYEKAWHSLITDPQVDKIPALLRARISSGFAYASVKNGDAERAKSLLSQTHEIFPQPTSLVEDHTPLYADCGVHSLYLWEGLTRRLLNQPEEAGKTFAEVEHLPAMNILVPERTHIEIITHQAATALVQGNMEAFCSYFIATMDGIARIQSEKRRQEAIMVYKHARQEWPDEKRILKLADLFAPLHS